MQFHLFIDIWDTFQGLVFNEYMDVAWLDGDLFHNSKVKLQSKLTWKINKL